MMSQSVIITQDSLTFGRVPGASGKMCLVGIAWSDSEPEGDSGLCPLLGCGRWSSPMTLVGRSPTRWWLQAGMCSLRVMWKGPLGPGEKTWVVVVAAFLAPGPGPEESPPLLVQAQMQVQ